MKEVNYNATEEKEENVVGLRIAEARKRKGYQFFSGNMHEKTHI